MKCCKLQDSHGKCSGVVWEGKQTSMIMYDMNKGSSERM